MNTCKTCKHWKSTDGYDGHWRASEVIAPTDYDTFEKMKMTFEMRLCLSPKKLFFERPPESDMVTLIDGSEYLADMVTGENFGCVNHEAE